MTLFQTRPKTDEGLTRLSEQVEKLTREVSGLRGERDALKSLDSLERERTLLKREVEDLKIEKDRMKEEHERDEREMLHKVGLAQLRQEAEAEQNAKDVENAKREARIEVREENLNEERDAFEKNMGFITERMEKENKYVRKMFETILTHLPNVNMEIVKGLKGDDGE